VSGYNRDASRVRFWKDQDGICPLCEGLIPDPEDHQDCNVDHKIPKSHGGSDARSNLQLTHRRCNEAKGCGCPGGHPEGGIIGNHPADYRFRVWRAQDFKCSLCGDTVTPSEVKLVDDAVSHPDCLRIKYRGV
jgi:5-methylcytosine-specific restriction endonuclease McrA